MLDIIIDTLIDSIKLLPFLFVTYLILEYLEHKTGGKAQNVIKKSGKFGPAIGSLLGIVPQCGFSAAAANFYAGKVISLGTLIAIFLSTSDEMLPILISEAAPISLIGKVILIKLLIGMVCGFIIDLFSKFNNKEKNIEKEIEHLCEHDHCDCEHGVVKSAIKHSLNIFVFIIIVSFILNLLIHFIGEDTISSIFNSNKILGPILASFVGLIPNCASSVILTQLNLSGVIPLSTMISGLLVNAGLGLLVLFRVNNNLKENIFITTLLYVIGVLSGFILSIFL